MVQVRPVEGKFRLSFAPLGGAAAALALVLSICRSRKNSLEATVCQELVACA